MTTTGDSNETNRNETSSIRCGRCGNCRCPLRRNVQCGVRPSVGAVWRFSSGSGGGGEKPASITIDYVPLQQAEKPWRICALYPHLQDSYWVALNYGVIEEAKRLGVKVSVFQAGGYTALPRQISQYDDCLAAGVDAIVVGVVSEAGVAAKINEGMAQGIVTVGVANPIQATQVSASIIVDHYAKGFITGEYIKEWVGAKPDARAGAFPGPQSSGWAETYLAGFRDSMKTGSVRVLTEQFGEASVPAQLRLVEDALQTYPDMNIIWGGAPTAEAALGAIADAGRDDITIVASYENQTMLKAVADGRVAALATEYPVMIGRIGVDLAVRALEAKPIAPQASTALLITPGLVTQANLANFDLTQIFAPDGTQPEFFVK